MFNNSQLCSQAPSPQREPHHAACTQLACCSVCVQSPWYHRWACSPILAGYNAETCAVVLIIQHGIVQEGVYSVSLAPAFFSNLLRSLPKHGAWSVSGPACGAQGRLCGRKNGHPWRGDKVPVLMSYKWKLFVLISVCLWVMNHLTDMWPWIQAGNYHVNITGQRICLKLSNFRTLSWSRPPNPDTPTLP